ncbi:MAG: hypothetical protein GW875_07180 [Deltaproteobacteria bacterium]|nr:hypothetical protein [Deltaproteobacteria bacterium]NCP03001.1 hypothetical protein [Deltaproteobacteria bacterium]
MSKQGFSCLFFLTFLVFGCAGVSVVPRPNTAGQINAQEMSIRQTYDQVRVTARVMDLEVRPYQMRQNICSFQLEIRNEREQPIFFPAERFLLTDEQGNQYRPVSPEQIAKMVTELDPYLIPYPYLGYYYAGDAEQAKRENQFNSQVTYFPTRDARAIAVEALPDGKVEADKQISGLIYFLADLRTMKGFNLQGSAVLAQGTKSTVFSFPFDVIKK